MLTPDLTVVIVLGYRFFEDLTVLPRGNVESSQNSFGKSKVDCPFVFWNILSLNLRPVMWFSSCLKQQKTT